MNKDFHFFVHYFRFPEMATPQNSREVEERENFTNLKVESPCHYEGKFTVSQNLLQRVLKNITTC